MKHGLPDGRRNVGGVSPRLGNVAAPGQDITDGTPPLLCALPENGMSKTQSRKLVKRDGTCP